MTNTMVHVGMNNRLSESPYEHILVRKQKKVRDREVGDAEVRSLAGNGMQVSVVGAVHLFVLGFVLDA